MRRMRHQLICTLSLLAGSAAAAAVDAGFASGADSLEEIIITAEKQVQGLQEADAAVTAIPASTLIDAGVEDLRDAQKLVPSARFQAEGNNTQVIVRGVGSALDLPNIEPTVAFNLAGIYLPREATSAAFFDVEQLEVLPGPQGTLYGRSAVGGTINLTPTRPAFNDQGFTLLEVANYAAVHITESQNIKASDSLAFRAAVDWDRNDGFEVSGADSKDNVGIRLSTLYNAGEALSAYLWVQAAGKYGNTANLVNKGLNPNTGTYCEGCFLSSDPWNDTRAGKYVYPFGTIAAERNDFRTLVVGGQIDYHLEGTTLTYLPSYLYLDTAPYYWLGAIEAVNTDHYNQITQELRLASSGSGPFKWLGGIYFYDIRNNGLFTLFPNTTAPFIVSDVASDSLKGYALFGQATYAFADTFRGTVGARASTTQRSADGNEPVALGGLPYTFDKTFSNIDWKLGLEKDLSAKVMLYGDIQTGYQPGTFNELPDTSTYSNEVKPSRLLAYTAGVKSRSLDDRLQINDEAFYYDYRDLLIQSYNISAVYNSIFNAQKVAIWGDQLDVLGLVSVNDQINLNVGYSHARNVDFNTPAGVNYDGYQLAYSPDLTAAAGYTHSIAVGTATVRAHIDWRFESSWWGDYVHNRGTRQEASNKGDASLTYDAKRWTVGAWIKNIQNRPVIAAIAASGIPGPATTYLEDPRTFGLRFTMKH